ncbi:fungal-specific transcription factor domain-containing protein [Aspergillus varians]
MKRHYCAVAGCGKSFSRPSHLQRHALNHSKSQWVCSRCTAAFKRLDLFERHKARHASKDRGAGGVGLGRLGTKNKFLGRDTALNIDSSPPSPGSRSREGNAVSLHQGANPHGGPHGPTVQGRRRPSLNTAERIASEPVLDQYFLNGISEPDEIGNMYHDMTFDLVHFNVTGFATQQSDRHLSPSEGHVDSLESDPGLQPIDTQFQRGSAGHSEGSPSCSVRRSHRRQHGSQHTSTAIVEPSLRVSVAHSYPTVSDTTTCTIRIPLKKKNELVELIAEIRPVRPDGRLIDGRSTELTLDKIQMYLDLFLTYFNTSYPLVHVPSLDISNTDPIVLLSFIIMGATYKDKEAHQLSVCMYDAIIPYIFSGLLSNMVPDLTILQAFMVLECYGMYRAGPYQRENAILIHCLLLNSISRVSRYHVRACITLPGRLTHVEGDWLEFSYAEQYKRLIMFFFMWDTQNATCYSIMPNISTQSLQLELPCPRQQWDAKNEAEWKSVVTSYENPCTFPSLVEEFMSSTYHELSRPYDMLDFTLALHGLMSVCNDLILSDRRPCYFNMLRTQQSIWSTSREKMAYALSSWKAKYEAFAMDALRNMETERERSQFQRDNTGVYALYHTAHIVINCEIRHIQIAAGARAIFGHVVTHNDYEDSCNWVRNWLRNSADSAGRAAWHAAQLFREGMLSLKNWDGNGVFHYPWCLYIATLTCWAYHQFEAERTNSRSQTQTVALRERSRTSMHHLVATMASVTPAYMNGLMGKCCTHGLTIEMTKYLRSIRWTAAYEAMKVLEGLSKLPTEGLYTLSRASYGTA